MISNISDVLSQAISDRLVGAVVVVLCDGEVLCREAVGWADREHRRPMTLSTLFRLSSLTKPIVTAAALALAEQGLLDLHAPIARWLPEFQPRAADGTVPLITLHHLLTHTAGLTYRVWDPSGPYAMQGVSDGLDRSGIPMAEELRRIASVPLSYLPGTAWGYSIALDVAGEVIARANSSSLAAAVEQWVTKPLGLDDIGFSVTDVTRLSAPYVDGFPPRLMSDPESVAFPESSATTIFSPTRVFDSTSFTSGGSGMVGSALEFATFLEALRLGGSPILCRASVEMMMSNRIGSLRVNTEPTPAWGFGYGGAVLIDPMLANTPQSVGTWKWAGIYGHNWFVDPTRRLTAVILTNTTLEGFCGTFVTDIRNAIYGSL